MAIKTKKSQDDKKIEYPAQNSVAANSSYIDPAKIAQRKGQLFSVLHLPSGQDLSFFAYVTSINEAYSSNFTREAVYGRMDPIHVFANTQRVVSVQLQVVSATFEEARANYGIVTKHFVNMLYPTYKKFKQNYRVISSPPVLGLKHVQLLSSIGNALGGQYSGYLIGTLDGLNISPNFNFGVYERAMAGATGPSDHIYPKIIDVGFTFHVLHDYDLGWNVASDEQETPEKQEPGVGGGPGPGDGTGATGPIIGAPVPKKNPDGDGSEQDESVDGGPGNEDTGDAGEQPSPKPFPGSGDVTGGDGDTGVIIGIDPDTGEEVYREPIETGNGY